MKAYHEHMRFFREHNFLFLRGLLFVNILFLVMQPLHVNINLLLVCRSYLIHVILLAIYFGIYNRNSRTHKFPCGYNVIETVHRTFPFIQLLQSRFVRKRLILILLNHRISLLIKKTKPCR